MLWGGRLSPAILSTINCFVHFSVSVTSDSLLIDWGHGIMVATPGEHISQSKFSLEWLRANCYSPHARKQRLDALPSAVLWSHDDKKVSFPHPLVPD